MTELLSLKFGNLRSFIEDQHIVFEGRDKLIQIDGRNENTGGSSGAGKTSILMALDYLLNIGDVPTTVLQSRLTKDGIWAIGEFKFDGIPVTIHRSKKDGLVIEMPDETISGNSKLAEEKLDQLIGFSKKIFKKMVHKKQKEGGFFLNMTPKETYEFLVSVLGLEKNITDIEKISIDIDTCKKQLSDKTTSIQLTQSSLKDIERILFEKQRPESLIDENEILKIRSNMLQLKDKIANIQNKIKISIDEIPQVQEKIADFTELNAKIANILPQRADLNSKIESMDQIKVKIESELNAIPFAMEKIIKNNQEIEKIKSEKEHMEQSQCPTCMQAWVGDTIQQKIEMANLSIKQLTAKNDSLNAIIDQKPQLQDKLSRLLAIREGIKNNLTALQEERAALDAEKYQVMESTNKQNETIRLEYRSQVELIQKESRAIIDSLSEELKQIEIDCSSKESQLKSYATSVSQYEKEAESINKLIAAKRQDLEQSIGIVIRLNKQLVVAEESKRMIKAYVLQTFQETLDMIGEVSTNILSSIPNMATSTIYFESCKETKSGAIKDEIVAIVNSDGENDIPIKSLSGGERTAIDLAVDLAVIDVIETKVSKGANFFFMDEPFDGLDSVCKENCLEILKRVDTNKKIIMVDHSSELKEMVSDVILVVKKGETSTIAV